MEPRVSDLSKESRATQNRALRRQRSAPYFSGMRSLFSLQPFHYAYNHLRDFFSHCRSNSSTHGLAGEPD